MSTPRQLGRYIIECELGRGAMGVVYRARDPRIDRPVALKTLAPVVDGESTGGVVKERFLNEGKAAGRLSHPAIVAVHDADEDPETGTAYLAMELVDGTDLREMMRSGIDIPRLVNILHEVAHALDHAHERGVVHRDVKPANILIDKQGRPHLTDFGIARLASSTVTQSGDMLGTPAYMAPEQVRGGVVSARTDIFALGVILYEGLTRRRPFEGDSIFATTTAIATADPEPPTNLASVPPSFDRVVARALAKDPELRYPSALEFAADVKAALLEQGPPSQPPPVTTGPKPPAPRTPASAIWLVAAGLGAVLLLVLAAVLMSRDEEAPGQAAEGIEAAAPATDSAPATTAPAPAAARRAAGSATPATSVATGVVRVELSSPRAGTLSVLEGDKVLARLRIETNESRGIKGIREFERDAEGSIRLPTGVHDLIFRFDPVKGEPLLVPKTVAVASDVTPTLRANVGLRGREMDVKER